LTPALVVTMARIAVLRAAAPLGPLWQRETRQLVDAGLVTEALALTGKGVVVLRAETARMAGRRLSAAQRQLPLFT
jgi:hypothetical protein